MTTPTIDVTSNRYFYFRAAFTFGVWSGNVEPTQFFGPINFTKLEITPPKQKMTRLLSNMKDSFGQLLDAEPSVTDPATIDCEFDSMTGGMLNMIIGSTTSVINQTGAAVTSESVGTPVVGTWQRFATTYIDPAVAVVFKDATPATIPASNFEVDYVNAMWRPLTTAGALAVTVGYSTATRTGERYDAGAVTNQGVMLVGKAIEMASNRECSIQIHKANLLPAGKIDPVGNNYLKGALTGDLLLPHTYPSAWRFEYTDQVG